MWPIGNMVWRIGELLDVHDQIAWIREHGFAGVAFHAHAGAPGAWQGVDPAACRPAQRAALRDEISSFTCREIHAPFGVQLLPDSPAAGLTMLTPIMAFAADVNATVLTVHAELPPAHAVDALKTWHRVAAELNAVAAAHDLLVGLEILTGFEQLGAWQLSHVGVTLDVGHMALTRATDQPEQTTAAVVAAIAACDRLLVHLHVHDVLEQTDHMEVGAGRLDFRAILHALTDIRYRRGMVLELNPARVSPAGILRSRNRLAQSMAAGRHTSKRRPNA